MKLKNNDNKIYDDLKKKYDAAYKKSQAAGKKVSELNKLLEKEKRNLKFKCGSCETEIKIGDIELILEYTNGSFNSWTENYDYTENAYLVCNKCKEVLLPPSDKEIFPYGIKNYVKKTYEWYSGTTRCSGRVLELLTPSIKRREEETNRKEKERKLEEARKLLRDTGELKDGI